MPRSAVSPAQPRVGTAIITALVIAILFFAREFLIPLALAVLLSFMLSPLVIRLQRFGMNRVAAVVIVVMLSLTVVVGIGYVVAIQVLDLADNLPEYRENIKSKAARLRSSAGSFGKLSKDLSDFGKELTAPAPTTAPASQPAAIAPTLPAAAQTPSQEARQTVQNLPGQPTTQPIQVEIKERDPTPTEFLNSHVAPYLGPFGVAGMVIVFVVFFLLQLGDLRDRLIRLVSGGELTITTQALDDAATRISRYLLMQLIVNVSYGIPIALGLWFIGVPNAILWGLLATILRFIPYVGPWIAASFPLLIAFAAFPGWRQVAYTGMLFVVMELISNNVVEPWLYGSSTGMSAVAVIVSAVFWTFLWGPIGLLMSTPLTVCLVVLGKYVPQLRFLDILLGDEPVLEPHARVYQRLLAYDQEEAIDLIEEYLEKSSLVEVYDSILIPALRLAEQERHAGKLDDERQQFVRRAMKEIVEDLGDRHQIPNTQTGPGSADDVTPETATEADPLPSIICLPARDEADEIAGMMLAQILSKSGAPAKFVSVSALASEMIQTVRDKGSPIVCISALPPSAVAHARYLCKRVRQHHQDLNLLFGIWAAKAEPKRIATKLGCSETDKVVISLADAVQYLVPLIQTRNAEQDQDKDREEKNQPPINRGAA